LSQLRGKKNADNIVIMEMLSDKYGWTPSEIRKQRVSDIKMYLQILREKNTLQKYYSKKYGR